MRGMFWVLISIFVAMLCWGTYGPILQIGKHAMGESSLRPFICVGLAYFGIAVVVPLAILMTRGEKGQWTPSGITWSLIAGAAGALGALGIILALAFHGSPVFIMPIVFGCAPVVNTFYTMYTTRSYRQAGPIFFAGLILVIAGAVSVLVFRPPPEHAAASAASLSDLTIAFVFTAMTALCWGVYGPILHKGQLAMQGSRLRPFACVGLAYFLIAVLVPAALLGVWQEPGAFTFKGTAWSLASGAAGAIGALGIIMAFNFGGKPIYVMPLVFGGAPVINTFVALRGDFSRVDEKFFAGLIVVVAGAVTVLVFAPRAGHAPAHHEPEAPPAEERVPSG